MNVIKLILIIVAVLGFLAVCVTPATADTIVWDGEVGSDWFNRFNWVGDVRPGPDDDVIIGEGATVLIAGAANPDAECKTLDIERGTFLTIQGHSLKLGDPDADTTSNLAEGDIGGGYQLPSSTWSKTPPESPAY